MRVASLFRPLDASTLAVYRVAFALLMIHRIVKMWWFPEADLRTWEFRPVYAWTPFLDGWTAPDVDVVCPLMLLGLAGLAIGLLTRASAALFAGVYAYTFLLNPAAFNNHYYLITLTAVWFCIVGANAEFSVDKLLRRGHGTVPAWHYGVLRFQWCVAYFYGGLAKINSDWLQGEPVGAWFTVDRRSLLAEDWAGYVIGYSGLVFDLVAPFLLCWRPTRTLGIALAVIFHVTNSYVFRIGVFPYMGIASLLVFCDADAGRRWVSFATNRRLASPLPNDAPEVADVRTPWRRFVVAGLVVYAAVQLLLPFRHVLSSGWVEWNEEGKNFSWRMMLSHKETFVGMGVVDLDAARYYEVDQGGAFLEEVGLERGERGLAVVNGRPFLFPSRLVSRQSRRGVGVWGNPRLLAQYAKSVADDARALGIRRPYVKVDAVCSLNGRPFQYLVDPDVDLASVETPLIGTPGYVVPLEPHQPIGQYTGTLQELHDRVMEVILAHRGRR